MSGISDKHTEREPAGLLADDLPQGVFSHCEGALDDLRPSERERLRHITSISHFDPWEGCWWSPFGGE